ncbi:MAG: NAD(P)/FAD-dependent oxidoreductase [Alphaproteobacteria bacterium]
MINGAARGYRHVAVLGGGLQGCCTAIELAKRGSQVTLYDRNNVLLAGAATANEGKIHLGYVYGSDPSLATARLLLRGARSFAPLVRSYLETEHAISTSGPFLYAVHRNSQLSVEHYGTYLNAVHDLIASAKDRECYFGADFSAPVRQLTRSELEKQFDPDHIIAAFATPEIAIDVVALASAMRRRISQEPAIEVRSGCSVTAVSADDRGFLVNCVDTASGVTDSARFSSVVNALWDGRLAIDATLGIRPLKQWIHRLRHGIRFRLDDPASLPSVTLTLGPFGDLVAYNDGSYYVSWYPACMTATSDALAPPDWPAYPDEPLRTRIVSQSFAAFGQIIPKLRNASPREVVVRAGVIVAWGSTDIDDRGSELHRRSEIGVHSRGRYHSIDPGKLSMAPYFAAVCADRIMSKSST